MPTENGSLVKREGYYLIMTKRKSKSGWEATLARLVSEVQAETRVPVPSALKDAFAERGFPIGDLSGRLDPKVVNEGIAEIAAILKKKES